MGILLTFDVGTTSMKCCAFDENLQLIAGTTAEYALITRGAHIVEADPNIYWEGMCKSIRALEEKGICLTDVISCGITTQGETTIVLDKDGNPVCPAIVWLDDRADAQAAELSKQISSQQFYQTTGMPEIVKYLFSSSKVAEHPPLRATAILAPTFMVLSKRVL